MTRHLPSPSFLPYLPHLLGLSVLTLVHLPSSVDAILPTGQLEVISPLTGDAYTLLASQASFGSYPPMRSPDWLKTLTGSGKGGGDDGNEEEQEESPPLLEVVLPPDDDPLLCDEYDRRANYTSVSSSWRSSLPSLMGTHNNKKDVRNSSPNSPNPRTAMLVPRGRCPFERKALSAQRLGASALLIHGALSSRYDLNTTLSRLPWNATEEQKDEARREDDKKTGEDGWTLEDVVWPLEKMDYDCERHRAEVPTSLLSFASERLPYDERNDDKLIGGGEENLCVRYAKAEEGGEGGSSGWLGSGTTSFADRCPSERCLLTGRRSTSGQSSRRTEGGSSGGGSNGGGGGGTVMEACCAWDLHVWLYSDASIPGWVERVRIPAFYVTMEQGDVLYQTLKDSRERQNGGNDKAAASASASAVGVVLSARWAPRYNPSAVMIWALGVLICFVAAYMSAADYRAMRFEAKKRLFEMTTGGAGPGLGVPPGDAEYNNEEQVDKAAAPTAASAAAAAAASTPYRDEPPVESMIPSADSGDLGGGSRNGTPRSRSRSRSRSPPSPAPAATSAEESAQGHYAPSHAVGPLDDAAPIDSDSVSAAASTSAAAAARSETYQHADSRPRSSFNSQQDETLELDTSHALGFVIMASCSLTVLFVFKIYNIVKIMYAFGCSGAMTQVLFFPLWDRIGIAFGMRRKLYRTAFNAGQEFGPVTYLDLLAGLSGYGLGLAWLITAFVHLHPEDLPFFYITQDVMGSCMCILFLSIIKLNSIRVASVLLIIAFFYDIFFVFITPLLTKGGKSIMITVATSGGPPKADPSWCEKYPKDDDCKGGDPLPMLLTVPRIFDYQGGSSLLGLGDIVLPGLLLSFAARYDEAKKLVNIVKNGNAAEIYPRSYNCLTVCGRSLCKSGGYLIPVTIAYGIGLAMANIAVYLMQMGQPALLYLVPCCLGTMSYLGWKNHELQELWDGPKAIKMADALMYGEYYEEEEEYVENGGGGEAAGPEYEPTIAELPPKEEHIEPTEVVVMDGSTSGDVPLLQRKRAAGGDKSA